MGTFLKLVGGLVLVVLLVAGAGIADFALNGGRVGYALLGRDRIEAACRPELARVLADRGFAPAEIEFAARPNLDVNFGRDARLAGGFTFTDGPGGERVDGAVECVVTGPQVRVEVRVRANPHRAA